MKVFTDELKKLDPDTRNKVRGILSSDFDKSVPLVNKLRKICTPQQIVQANQVITSFYHENLNPIPDLFPKTPQTTEDYNRLEAITLEKKLKIIEILLSKNKSKVIKFVENLSKINKEIAEKNFTELDKTIQRSIEDFGYSQIIFRKAAVIQILNTEKTPIPSIEKLIEDSKKGNNNLIVSSVLQCYQIEHDFLSTKKSIMSLKKMDDRNRFTRDISRIPFHPHAKDDEDFCKMIQSNLQSSLVDAILIIKINQDLIKETGLKNLNFIFELIESSSNKIEHPSSFYLNFEDPEQVFYKHSSAWLEMNSIIKYRDLQDHFYDDPNSSYINLNDKKMKSISKWISNIDLEDLSTTRSMTKHNIEKLRKLESIGTVTRSSVFNYILHVTRGDTSVSEEALFKIMGTTRDLDKTINTEYVGFFAENCQSDLSKILLHILIARKSKNEADDYILRRLIQNSVIKQGTDGSLVNFIDMLSNKSLTVAQYTYNICNEGFISKLSHIISSSAEITENRAALHRWMGEKTSDSYYLDRARTLLIDHQINKIRNELDDNRIYVDTVRFLEWLDDELSQEINRIITNSVIINNEFGAITNQQLMDVIDRAYNAFCTNKFFGIASYLGRRIRHGTFKGHMYSSVISIEKKYPSLFKNTKLSSLWEKFKNNYESIIDEIMKERLHVESETKKNGFLKPNIKGQTKSETAISCAKDLLKNYIETNSTNGSSLILTEYCWRIAEVDLKNINKFLKDQKQNSILNAFITDFKSHAISLGLTEATDFSRELTLVVNERISTMYGWFKRPLSASPKASLNLLFKAVVEEVRVTYPNFRANVEDNESTDIEVFGLVYHIFYDAFFVVVFNAAKHGHANQDLEKKFIVKTENNVSSIEISIISKIKDEDSEDKVSQLLQISNNDDISNAQLYENRSGIKKLYHLSESEKNFSISEISCKDRKVVVSMKYLLKNLMESQS